MQFLSIVALVSSLVNSSPLLLQDDHQVHSGDRCNPIQEHHICKDSLLCVGHGEAQWIGRWEPSPRCTGRSEVEDTSVTVPVVAVAESAVLASVPAAAPPQAAVVDDKVKAGNMCNPMREHKNCKNHLLCKQYGEAAWVGRWTPSPVCNGRDEPSLVKRNAIVASSDDSDDSDNDKAIAGDLCNPMQEKDCKNGLYCRQYGEAMWVGRWEANADKCSLQKDGARRCEKCCHGAGVCKRTLDGGCQCIIF